MTETVNKKISKQEPLSDNAKPPLSNGDRLKHNGGNGSDLPPPSFSHLIISIASTAVIKMGLSDSNKEEKDLKLSRYNIDLLDLLREKTKNNLSKEEQELLDSCSSDLKLQFIQATRQAKEQTGGQTGEQATGQTGGQATGQAKSQTEGQTKEQATGQTKK